MIRLLVVAGIVAVFTANVCARPIQIYTYERLFADSQFVFIATPLATAETKDVSKDLGADYAGRNTTFVILHTLKGKAVSDKCEILHFKYTGTVPVDNAPHLVDFLTTPKDKVVEWVPLYAGQSPQYFLFLNRMPDGRYEPVSGQTDPVMSIRKLSAPPEVENQPKAR